MSGRPSTTPSRYPVRRVSSGSFLTVVCSAPELES